MRLDDGLLCKSAGFINIDEGLVRRVMGKEQSADFQCGARRSARVELQPYTLSVWQGLGTAPLNRAPLAVNSQGESRCHQQLQLGRYRCHQRSVGQLFRYLYAQHLRGQKKPEPCRRSVAA